MFQKLPYWLRVLIVWTTVAPIMILLYLLNALAQWVWDGTDKLIWKFERGGGCSGVIK